MLEECLFAHFAWSKFNKITLHHSRVHPSLALFSFSPLFQFKYPILSFNVLFSTLQARSTSRFSSMQIIFDWLVNSSKTQSRIAHELQKCNLNVTRGRVRHSPWLLIPVAVFGNCLHIISWWKSFSYDDKRKKVFPFSTSLFLTRFKSLLFVV
jgi:hypothetical protein